MMREVVGVVNNVVVIQVGEDPQPMAYLPMTQEYAPFVTLQVRTTGDPNASISAVRSVVQQLDTEPRDHQRADDSRNHERRAVGSAHGRGVAHAFRRHSR